MLWAGAVYRLRYLLKRGRSVSSTLTESVTLETTEDGLCQLSSMQPESSGSNGDLILQEWPSVNSLVSGTLFSEAIPNRVTTEQQGKRSRRSSPLTGAVGQSPRK